MTFLYDMFLLLHTHMGIQPEKNRWTFFDIDTHNRTMIKWLYHEELSLTDAEMTYDTPGTS